MSWLQKNIRNLVIDRGRVEPARQKPSMREIKKQSTQNIKNTIGKKRSVNKKSKNDRWIRYRRVMYATVNRIIQQKHSQKECCRAQSRSVFLNFVALRLDQAKQLVTFIVCYMRCRRSERLVALHRASKEAYVSGCGEARRRQV